MLRNAPEENEALDFIEHIADMGDEDSAQSPTTGLREPSQAMVDKIMAVRRDKCGAVIGHLGQAEMMSLNRTLALGIGIAD